MLVNKVREEARKSEERRVLDQRNRETLEAATDSYRRAAARSGLAARDPMPKREWLTEEELLKRYPGMKIATEVSEWEKGWHDIMNRAKGDPENWADIV
jgi:hypothetical protein